LLTGKGIYHRGAEQRSRDPIVLVLVVVLVLEVRWHQLAGFVCRFVPPALSAAGLAEGCASSGFSSVDDRYEPPGEPGFKPSNGGSAK